MPNPEIRKFEGLYLQQNSFNVPDGAMEIAENVVIQSDDIITKSKGYFEWWRPGGGDTLTDIQGLHTYQGQVIGVFANGIGHFADTLPFGGVYDTRGVLTANTGATCSFNNKTFFTTANQNLYVTGLDGIYRLEAFDSKVRKAGVPQALSIQSASIFSNIGVLPSDSQTGYRPVFGRRDANGNLLLSAPGDITYVGVPAPVTMAAYSISGGVVTVTTTFARTLSGKPNRVGQVVNISSATNTALNGSQTITGVTSSTFRFATVQPDSAGTLTVSASANASLVADIPAEINDITEGWFVQFYRTSSSLGVSSGPFADFKLVTEQNLTQNDLNVRIAQFTDNVDGKLLGAQLYTNPNTREGPLAANYRPPSANVLSFYKGYTLYSDVQTVQTLELDMINVYPGLLGNDLTFTNGTTTEVYTNSTNIEDTPNAVTGTGTGVITVNITNPIFGTPAPGEVFDIYNITGTLPSGSYTVLTGGFNTFTFNAPGFTMTAATIAFKKQAGKGIYENFSYSGITTVQNLQIVAQELVRSINRNSTFMYANYVSTFDDLPGKIVISSWGISAPIYVKLNFDPVARPFLQPIPTSFSTGVQVYSENDVLPNALFFSKEGEPEAVPRIQFFLVGEDTGRILSTYAIRDCVIIVKEDGIYKLTGYSAGDFNVSLMDVTVKFPSNPARASAPINNTVIGLCNQGLVQITESGVQIISRRVDDAIQILIGLDLSKLFLAGNEQDRLFDIHLTDYLPDGSDVCGVYNVLNETWTRSTSVFRYQALAPDDANLGILFDAEAGSLVVHRQRKTRTLVDYTGKYVVGTIDIESSKLSGFFVVTGGNPVSPAVGDAILFSNVFSRITKATAGGGGFMLEFSGQTNIPVGPNAQVTVYKAYKSTVKMAPFHAGQVGLSKHFSEFQIALRQAAISDISISFAGQYLGSSEETKWSILKLSSEGSSGWGYSPWGFFPWGLSEGIKMQSGTLASSIIRTYIPRFAARNTYIQPILEHQVAGQPMLVQSMQVTCRGYGNRTSK